MFSKISAKLVSFLYLKTEFYCSYVLALFTNFGVVAAIPPIMAKLIIILRSLCVNTSEFWNSLGKQLKVMMILPLMNILCYHMPDFEDSSILTTNNNKFKVTLMESLLINRDHPPLNKNMQSLPWNFLILEEQSIIT